VLKWSKDNENQKMAKHFLMFLDEVPESKNVKNDFNQWSSGRDMNYYQPVLPWLTLILNQQSPFALKDKNAGISFLLPMEVLFERYVAKILAKDLPKGYRLTEQSTGRHLTNQPKAFALRPDILITKDKKSICVLDTKWKLIDENQTYENGNQDRKKGINQSDVYQLFAYGKKYDVRKVVLIYPQWANFKKEFSFKIDADLELCVKPFALDSDKMTNFNLEALLHEKLKIAQ
jgi:5-methylcytosine-specific restriction enzyme subunit McrC